jgi:GNAT superfamily N-acetyltransferase
VSLPLPAFRFEIQPMTESDLPAAHELSRAVGWPHRVEDWQFVLSVGHGLAARSEERLVGTAMWWVYESQARLGMVIVDPTIQRAGIGRGLMNGILEQLAVPSIVLNATQAGEPLYRQLGFHSIGSIVQHQGAAFSVPLVPLREGERIRPLGRNDLPRLVELDALATGTRRERVIAALIEAGDAVVLDDAGETVGFAFYRRFGRGHVIGPVVARDTAAAKALVAHWIGSNAGMFVRIDVTGQSGLSGWLEELGLPPVAPVLTMVRGEPLPPPRGFHSFAVANQAIG